MFSRVAKSIVKTLGSRQIHISEKNFKIALIDGTKEINKTLSQLLKNSAKLNVLALYNVAAVNKSLPNYNRTYNFYDDQLFNLIPSKIPMTVKKSCLTEVSCPNITINNARKIDDNITFNSSNHQGNKEKSQIEKLVEALYRLPIAEKASTLNHPLISIDEIIPKAGDACSRMRPYTRILNEMGTSSTKICQRDYVTDVIRRFPDLTYPPFQEHDINFIPETKISKKHQSIKKKIRIKNSSSSAPMIAKENNRQLLSTFLLNHDKKLARGLIKKLRNIGILLNIEARCRVTGKSISWVITALSNNKSKLSYEICNHNRFSLPLLNFINYKRENSHEIAALDRNSKTMTDDTLNIVEEENWIQRMFSKIESILADLHAKIRSHSTIALDSYRLENIFTVNEVTPVSDIISNSTILFAPEDCESKSGIRKKIRAFCAQRKKSLKEKVDKNDICKNRVSSCKVEQKYQQREKICEGRVDCSERGKQIDEKQETVLCKGRKSCDKRNACDCLKTRKVESQEDLRKEKCDDDKTREDLCKRRCMEQKQTFCKQQEKEPSKEEKKEEIKKPDCSEIKKIKPSEKKECPTVKKAPGCSEDNGKRKDNRKYSTYVLRNIS